MLSRGMMVFLCCNLALAACAPFRPDTKKAGLCNQLNSRIIFDGSTSDTRNSEIQSTEQPRVQSDYDQHCAPH